MRPICFQTHAIGVRTLEAMRTQAPFEELIMPEHFRITRNRREFLRDACGGFGGLAFGAMLAHEQARAQSANPLAPKKPHIPAKAKSVIFLFLSGGPSH